MRNIFDDIMDKLRNMFKSVIRRLNNMINNIDYEDRDISPVPEPLLPRRVYKDPMEKDPMSRPVPRGEGELVIYQLKTIDVPRYGLYFCSNTKLRLWAQIG